MLLYWWPNLDVEQKSVLHDTSVTRRRMYDEFDSVTIVLPSELLLSIKTSNVIVSNQINNGL